MRPRPIHTPSTTPSTITINDATTVDASVAIASDQTPVPHSRSTHTADTTAARTEPTSTVTATINAPKSHHGDSVSSVCSGSIRISVKKSLKPLVTDDRLFCTQSVTSVAACAMAGPNDASGGNSDAHT